MKKRQPPASPLPAHALPRSGSEAALAYPSATARSWWTVALVAHLFLVGVSYTAALEPSVLQDRLLRAFAPYLTTFHLDLDGRPVGWTAGEAKDRSHRVEMLPPAEEARWQRLEPRGWAGGERAQRYGRWAHAVARLAEVQNTAAASQLLESVTRAEGTRGRLPRRVRVVRLEPDPAMPFELMPLVPLEIYQAAVIEIDSESRPRLLSIAPERETAPPAPGRSSPGGVPAGYPDGEGPESRSTGEPGREPAGRPTGLDIGRILDGSS